MINHRTHLESSIKRNVFSRGQNRGTELLKRSYNFNSGDFISLNVQNVLCHDIHPHFPQFHPPNHLLYTRFACLCLENNNKLEMSLVVPNLEWLPLFFFIIIHVIKVPKIEINKMCVQVQLANASKRYTNRFSIQFESD